MDVLLDKCQGKKNELSLSQINCDTIMIRCSFCHFTKIGLSEGQEQSRENPNPSLCGHTTRVLSSATTTFHHTQMIVSFSHAL